MRRFGPRAAAKKVSRQRIIARCTNVVSHRILLPMSAASRWRSACTMMIPARYAAQRRAQRRKRDKFPCRSWLPRVVSVAPVRRRTIDK
jgi:hypothetical protein